MTYLNVIGSGESRLAWREHLINVALSEEQAEWEQGQYTEEEHTAFIRGMAMLIGNATFRHTEHTSDVEDAAYTRIHAQRVERERADKQAQRDRWVHAVATGATNKGFDAWLADRD